MKKVLAAVALLMVCCLCACGGGNDTESASEKEMPSAEKIDRSIDAIAEALGLTGGETTLYTVIEAEDGKEFNDGNVEIYQYEPTSDVYAKIENGEGVITAAACNDGFILVIPEGVEADEDMVNAFRQLEFK